MMRAHIVFVAVVVTLGAVACSSGDGTGAEGDDSESGSDSDGGGSDDDDETTSGSDDDDDDETTSGTGSGSGSGSDSELASEASCSSICEPYLVCKGLDTSYQAECTDACLSQGFTEAELDSYEELGCASLVEAIETAREGSGGGSGGTGNTGSGNDDYQQSQDCAYGECVRDGTYCVSFGTVTADCPQECCD
jgi:hypothetical protein